MSTQKIYVGSNPNSFSLVDNSVTKILFYFFIYIFFKYNRRIYGWDRKWIWNDMKFGWCDQYEESIAIYMWD